MRVYTIELDTIQEGAVVKAFPLKEIVIPAIIVGDKSQKNKPGVLPVHLLDENQAKEWQKNGETNIMFADVSTTKFGNKPKPILRARDGATNDENEKVIVVCLTPNENYHIGLGSSFPGEILVREVSCNEEDFMGKCLGPTGQLVAIIPQRSFFGNTHGGFTPHELSASYYYCDPDANLYGPLNYEDCFEIPSQE